MTATPTKKLLQQARLWLNKARNLDKYISLEEETRQFLNGNDENFVLYAVDTDIVMCYSSPWTLAVGRDAQVSYGEIFPPDIGNFQSATRLTFALAHHIFFELNNDWPVFQLPSHADETTNVFSAIAAQSRLDTVKARNNLSLLESWSEVAEREVSQFTSKHATNEKFLTSLNRSNESELIHDQDLDEILAQIETFIVNRGRSPNASMDRYLSLLLEGTLVSTNEASKIANDEESDVQEILIRLNNEGTLPEWIKEIERREEWIALLSDQHDSRDGKGKSKRFGKRRLGNVIADANALSKLETLNNRLKELNGRVILITGADAILEAAEEYDPIFKAKYIRHFHSFIPHLLANAEGSSYNKFENSGGTSDFLGFRALSYSDDRSRTKITNSIRSLLDADPDAFHDIEQEWVQVRDKMTLGSMTAAEGVKSELSNILLGDLADIKKKKYSNVSKGKFENSLSLFAGKIRKELVGERISLAVEFAATGIEFLLALGVSEERNPPDVCFDSYENANDLFNTLKERKSLKNIKPSLRDRLEDISSDTLAKSTGTNDLGYLQFLVFAGIFAAAGRWSIAAELAGYAVDIAEMKPATKSGSHVSGREAYYLQASAVRLSARRTEDYSIARDLLTKAKGALHEDKIDRPGLKIESYRFDVEEVAVSVSELHHLSMSQIYNDSKAQNYLRDALNIFEELRNTVNNRAVKIQININILQLVSVILQHKDENETTINFLEIVERTHRSINSFFDHDEDFFIRKTKLIESYMIFADCYLSANGKIKLDRRASDIEVFFDSVKGSTIYDKDRYEKLFKQCEKFLSSESV